MSPDSKLADVWHAIRDNGSVRLTDIAALTGHSPRSIAPLAWWLTHTGWAVSRGGWWASARTASFVSDTTTRPTHP